MKTHKVVTIVQARTGSARLPGKVLLPVLGETLLERMLERVAAAKLTGNLVVATSSNPNDDPIEKVCKSIGVNIFRGSEADLLDRHYQAGKFYNAGAIVKIPSDCPLIDPKIIDQVIGFYLENRDKYDFVSNLHPATFPDGNDVEIMSAEALGAAWQEAEKDFEREHTTPFIWENPERFRVGNVIWNAGLNYSRTHRWTIDYQEDYEFIRTVYEELYPRNPLFGLDDILALLKEKPEIKKINQKHTGKYWYEDHLDELRNIEEFKRNSPNSRA